jgi:hypothetical protein
LAHYVPSLGFDDLMIRLGLHCLQGDARTAAVAALEQLTPEDKLLRKPWSVPAYRASTLIKSNSFAIDCPAEMFHFDLKEWPERKVWAYIRECVEGRRVVAVPFKGKVLALGVVEDVKDAFGDNIKGTVERTPVGPNDLSHEDGAYCGRRRLARTAAMSPPDIKRSIPFRCT